MAPLSSPLALRTATAPSVPCLALDTVWFQVAGTLCNLTCRHCFISCSPTNHSHELMSRAGVRPYLDEARELGVRDFYFTGGEPFLNRELNAILGDTLEIGPATVLTHAGLITAPRAGELGDLARSTRYSLEMRVSLDGLTAEENDAIRGEGSFDAAIRGMRALAAEGFDPIVTVVQAWREEEDAAIRERLHAFLREAGLRRPRVKVLPLFRLGRETGRTRSDVAEALLTEAHMTDFDPWILQCSSSRMVTSRGVYVCPILIDTPAARMGRTLRETLRPFPLAHGACHTCWATGASCRN
jgi:molybdenum cofactor biosynthesis enzyme MoaA